LLVYLFWKNKNKYLTKYGILAYQKAFKFMLIGIPLLISVVIHSFLPTDLIFSYLISKDLSWYLATSLLDIFFIDSVLLFLIRLILGFFFVGIGLTVVLRTLKIFGIDNMGLVYVYFPEESTLQDHEIFSILRHPTYHALMLISIGSIFLRLSIYSFLYFLIYMIGINIHLKYVEEKELIQRFGESYIKYKKSVPAFLVRVRDLSKYFNFIFKK
jgi:protein-S-isoprenylcysteine O-methyltransferase Ste14